MSMIYLLFIKDYLKLDLRATLSEAKKLLSRGSNDRNRRRNGRNNRNSRNNSRRRYRRD